MYSLDIIIENTSPELRYEGDWVSAPPISSVTPLSRQLFTVPEGKKGSFSYNVSGILGLVVQGFRLESFLFKHERDYKVRCTVNTDGENVTVSILPGPSNWASSLFTLCEAKNLDPEKNYTLGVTIDSESPRNPVVWFDALWVDPAPTKNFDHSLVAIKHHHPMIQYDSHWEAESYNNVAHATNVSGSTVSLDFNGTSLKWYTSWNYFMDPSSTNITSTATWILDNETSQTFTNPNAELSDHPRAQRHRLIFEIVDLPPGLHHLEIVHHGDRTSRPLSLSSLIIQNARAGTNSSVTTMPGPEGEKAARTNIAIVIAGSVAAFLICTLLILYFYRRRCNTNRIKENINNPGEMGSSSASSSVPDFSELPTPSELGDSDTQSDFVKGTPVMFSTALSSYPHEPISSTHTPKSLPPWTTSQRDDGSSPPPYQAS